jgi:uncharacterized protein (TIGR03083 family)
MTDDRDLLGLDPYELWAGEAARIDRHCSALAGADWDEPSRCAGWTVGDVVAHLAATETYTRACLDGTVADLFAELTAKGATDLASFNAVGMQEYAGRSRQDVFAEWRATSAQNRSDFRARDGKTVDSSVGAYPARWQAFHLSFELATHADDIAVPVSAAEAAGRLAWQAQFGRFAFKEHHPDALVDAHEGRVHVKTETIDTDVSEREWVQALAARVPPESNLDPEVAAALSITP